MIPQHCQTKFSKLFRSVWHILESWQRYTELVCCSWKTAVHISKSWLLILFWRYQCKNPKSFGRKFWWTFSYYIVMRNFRDFFLFLLFEQVVFSDLQIIAYYSQNFIDGFYGQLNVFQVNVPLNIWVTVCIICYLWFVLQRTSLV